MVSERHDSSASFYVLGADTEQATRAPCQKTVQASAMRALEYGPVSNVNS